MSLFIPNSVHTLSLSLSLSECYYAELIEGTADRSRRGFSPTAPEVYAVRTNRSKVIPANALQNSGETLRFAANFASFFCDIRVHFSGNVST